MLSSVRIVANAANPIAALRALARLHGSPTLSDKVDEPACALVAHNTFTKRGYDYTLLVTGHGWDKFSSECSRIP
jgi:hypothetical protein